MSGNVAGAENRDLLIDNPKLVRSTVDCDFGV